MIKNLFATFVICIFVFSFVKAQTIDKSDWVGCYPDGCTSITVGKKASTDGSVFTSHTDDSHRSKSEFNIEPAKDFPQGSMKKVYKRVSKNIHAMPTYEFEEVGEIPEVAHTFRYINTAYPCLNEHQLGIGESTFGGRESLVSDNGIIDCTQLCQLMLERCKTAREAITLAGELIKEHGWIDVGECLTIADKTEVWHLEIVGPGKGNKGGIWVAQRVPDEHISVNANASTIKHIDLQNSDMFMASENIYKMALDSAWCSSVADFQFCYAYAPESRNSIAARRREWRVFDLVAPSLKLDANDKDYPFSVKPDKPVSIEQLSMIFRDYYEGTPYDITHALTVTDSEGNTKISPMANPQMPYDQMKIENVRGSWYDIDSKTGAIEMLGERTIARWYTMYATIIQCRECLPDEIGGCAWIALDNVATSIYVPFYPQMTQLPKCYETPGRTNGFTHESAWWAFNRLGTLTCQRWGDMRVDVVDNVWIPWQKELFDNQKTFEQEVLTLFNQKKNGRKNAIAKLTEYSNSWGQKVVDKAWQLGDFLWTKYDEKF